MVETSVRNNINLVVKRLKIRIVQMCTQWRELGDTNELVELLVLEVSLFPCIKPADVTLKPSALFGTFWLLTPKHPTPSSRKSST